MGGRKKATKTPAVPARSAPARVSRGRTHPGGASFPVAPPRSELPRGYARTLGEIKQRIQQERLRVVLAANSAMVLLYWDIGRMILDRQEHEGWGAKVIDRLSADLREAYPDMEGFSSRNLLFMRSFAEACPDAEKVKQLVSQLPWGHVIRLLQRVKEPDAREWYIRKSIEHGWSRSILEMQIDARAHQRYGKALTNFKATLPPADSDLAAQVFKDPYLFDFLGTADPRREREIERALVAHIQRFLLELGAGFAFVGRQVPREEQDRRRVRAASSQTPHRRRRMGDEARREAPEGPEGEFADGGGDRGGAVWRFEADGEDSQEEIASCVETAKLAATIAANLEGLGYGG